MIAVDYTRTAESVMKTGADIKKWMSEQKVKIDLSALFIESRSSISVEDALMIMDEMNDELESIDAYIVKKNNNFVKLPADELGHFYSGDCYVFLCRYYVQDDSSEEASSYEDEPKSTGSHPLVNGYRDQLGSQSPQNDGLKIVVYFWQGREASKMGWLSFTFSLQKKFEALFGNKLEVIQMHQQKENKFKFLSHFEQKFIIHRGRQCDEQFKSIEFFHLRSNNNPLTLRCIEIEPDSQNLNSGFCYILKLNYKSLIQNGYSNGYDHSSHEEVYETDSKIYLWIGDKACPHEIKIAKEIAQEKLKLGCRNLNVVCVQEGEEPPEFWESLGGKKEYDYDADYMKHIRLFRCSNDMGYFSISEKCSDFCQDDLSDDDIMILDNGLQVFLWIGPNSSEVEVKLAYKSAQVYAQNLKVKQPDRPRQLMLTLKGKESRKFTKSFHGWIH